MKDVWKIILILGVVGFILISLLGLFVPHTFIYLGDEMPKRYKREITKLGLVDEDETILYFYTDALFDIKDGMYFITTKKLVIYAQEWLEPATLIEFKDIDYLDIEYDDSFLDDSYVHLITHSGDEIWFPLSSERGRDKIFYKHLEMKIGFKFNKDDNVRGLDSEEDEQEHDTN